MSDTLFLLKVDYPKSSGNLSAKYFRSYGIKDYKKLTPRVNYKNFTLTNHAFADSSHEDLEKKPELISVNLLDFPSRWSEVLYYDKKYYFHLPSDKCGLNQKIVTDSCVIHKTCEGPYPIPLKSISRLSKSTYHMVLQNPANVTSSITVTFIDDVRGIAIWEYPNGKLELLANYDSPNPLPIAKAECNYEKCPFELRSDSLNFHALLVANK